MAGTTCPNCGTSLTGEMRYCPSCGQDQRERVVPVGQMMLDILRDNFAFDSKVFRSLPKLLFRPGFLTAEFVAGRRVRYIPAVRLYVFISVVAFLIFSLSRDSRLIRDGRVVDQEGPMFQVEGMAEAVAEVDSLGVEVWKERYIDVGDHVERFGRKLVLLNHQGLMPMVFERFRTQLPLPLLFMLPILALVLKLLIWRSYYVVHLVSAFHWAAFTLLVFALLYVVDELLRTGISGLAFVLGLVYLAFALRRAYSLGWLRSILSTLVTGLVTFVLLALTMLATMVYVVEQV